MVQENNSALESFGGTLLEQGLPQMPRPSVAFLLHMRMCRPGVYVVMNPTANTLVSSSAGIKMFFFLLIHNHPQLVCRHTNSAIETAALIKQLLFQQNALVFIKSTRYYNLYFLSLYS
jgi:hypothetical protein